MNAIWHGPKRIGTRTWRFAECGKELTASGEFVATQPLSPQQEARMVRVRRDGMPVTDGVFPESKKFLLGYGIVAVATPERAYAIAGRISTAPGRGESPPTCPLRCGN